MGKSELMHSSTARCRASRSDGALAAPSIYPRPVCFERAEGLSSVEELTKALAQLRPELDNLQQTGVASRTNSLLSDPAKVLDVVLNTSPRLRLRLGIGRRCCNQRKNKPVAFEFVSKMHPSFVSKHAGFQLNDVEHRVVGR
jgi:hypothetical protein